MIIKLEECHIREAIELFLKKKTGLKRVDIEYQEVTYTMTHESNEHLLSCVKDNTYRATVDHSYQAKPVQLGVEVNLMNGFTLQGDEEK
jgi:hypothetical protein